MRSAMRIRFSLGWAFLLTVLILAGALTLSAAQETWVKRNPTIVPTGRDDHMMAFDSERGWVIMLGGDNADSATWVWDGGDWRDLGIDNPPLTREAAMAFDSRRKVMVMFGGYDFAAEINSTATYEFDGEKWTGYTFDTVPDARSDHAMAFDEARGVMIMFGGDSGDENTWAYDGTSWYTVNQEGNTPGSRVSHDMVYDSEREVIVLFGGASSDTLYNDTWEWDGEKWTDVTPEEGNPPAMRDFAMVYDSLRQKTVLFGGRDAGLDGFNATWEWDGEHWTEIDTAVQPSIRHECAAAYDSWRNRMVLFGGSSGETEENRYKSDTWWYPNNPPDIIHDPVYGIVPGKDLAIRIAAFDYDGDDFKVFTYYRDRGESDYISMKMDQTSTNTYAAIIPASEFSDQGVDYYIAAIDREGSNRWGYFGTPDDPNFVTIGESGAVSIFIKPYNARKIGAAWRPVGAQDWIKSGKTARGLKPGKVVIEFKTIRKDVWRKPEDLTVEVIPGRKVDFIVEYTRRDQEQ
jgi:hypothetical protein